jgi:hypothetical protein
LNKNFFHIKTGTWRFADYAPREFNDPLAQVFGDKDLRPYIELARILVGEGVATSSEWAPNQNWRWPLGLCISRGHLDWISKGLSGVENYGEGLDTWLMARSAGYAAARL